MYPGQNKFNRYRQNLKKEIVISELIKKDFKDLANN
jgi:L-2-hydroxycarboxylate dehydrogenase (NAD+)